MSAALFAYCLMGCIVVAAECGQKKTCKKMKLVVQKMELRSVQFGCQIDDFSDAECWKNLTAAEAERTTLRPKFGHDKLGEKQGSNRFGLNRDIKSARDRQSDSEESSLRIQR